MTRLTTVEQVLKEQDFDTVWNYLESKFGYSKEWRTACHHYTPFAPTSLIMPFLVLWKGKPSFVKDKHYV